MKEVWKEIEGYSGIYQVSSKGNVKSTDRKVRTKGNSFRTVKGSKKITYPDSKGYLVTTLSKEGKVTTWSIHQLVAKAFIPGFEYGMEVNHIDGNPSNPSLDNLEISNPSHNQFHAVRTGLVKKRSVSKFRNVTYLKNPKAVNKWAASIRHGGKSSYGWKTFATEIEAAKYVDQLLDSINDTNRLRNFPTS